MSSLENIPSNLDLKESEILEYGNLKQLIQIENDLSVLGNELAVNDLDFLWDQLYSNSALVSERALDLLIMKNQISYVPPIISEEDDNRSFVQNLTNSFSAEQLNLFPNPFNEFLSYDNSERKLVSSVQFYDFQGKLVSLININTSEPAITIDTRTLPKGNYIVLVYDQNQELLEKQKCIKH